MATARSINDMEAVVFATNFYSSIAVGKSVDAALAEAKNALRFAWMVDATCIESLTREGLTSRLCFSCTRPTAVLSSK